MKKKEPMDSTKFMELSDNKKKKLIGEKVETLQLGIGKAALTDDGRVMVKVNVKCRSGKHKRAVYLTDAFTTGDLSAVYDKAGKRHGDLGNNIFHFCNCK